MPTVKANVEQESENGHVGIHKAQSSRSGIIDIITSERKCTWNKKKENLRMENLRERINTKYGINLENYWDLHKWSVENYGMFWEEVWHDFGIICSKPYEKPVNPAECFLDVEWFPGARLNYAENMLRYRDDNTALLHINEDGEETRTTYAEMFDQVALYSAALRKTGFKVGDTAACYMSNRSEAVFAMLATASLGGIFGGPLPFYGARAASNILKLLKPKVLFTVDKFKDEGEEFNILKNLPQAVKDVDTIERVVIVPSKADSLSVDISGIKNSCFLPDFLDTGKDTDGKVPELKFEQLPFNQPLFAGFTSGTTGMPKGILHSASNILAMYKEYGLHMNVDRTDVVLLTLSVGWNLWNMYIANLAMGATMILYEGNLHVQTKPNFWDFLAKYKVTNTFVVTSVLDRMEKAGIVAAPECNQENFRVLTVGASPVKPQNFEYAIRNLNEDAVVAIIYGCTEYIGSHGLFSFNEPIYSAIIHAPSLGSDLRCFDEEGNHVWGQRGELVIGTPSPAMAVDFFPDRKATWNIYFSPNPGVWTQHDEAWFDPVTKGFLILGRSDETLNPRGERFGSSEIYSAIHEMEELADYACVGQMNNMGEERVVLFVKLNKGYAFSKELVNKIKLRIEQELLDDFVPEIVLEAKDIPYNLNRKRMEKLVKTIIGTNKIPQVTNVRNPECLGSFCNIPELQGY